MNTLYRYVPFVLAVALQLSLNVPCRAQAKQSQYIQWEDIVALPDEHGFAGGYVGVSYDALIFAGGANFPDAPPWEGGTKKWHDSIFVLSPEKSDWQRVEKTLPLPLAYGISVSHENRVICVGGDNGVEAQTAVFAMQWDRVTSEIKFEQLADLPHAVLGMCGTVIDDTLYIAGGLDRLESDATRTLSIFWSLDLSDSSKTWQQLDTWPGPPRFQATSAAIGGQFYLMSGLELETVGGKTVRKSPVLRDCYRYRPGVGATKGEWTKLADMPRGAAAAANPCPSIGERHFMVVGGVDDAAFQAALGDVSKHPGFNRDCLAYHTITDKWVTISEFPDGETSRVTVPAVNWRGTWVIASGEAKPGIRSPAMFGVHAEHIKSGFGVLDWSALIVYLGLLVGVGFYFSRTNTTTESYFVGGRRIPWWAVGISIYGTQLSSITYVSTPAKVFDVGWLYYVSVLCIPAVAPIVIYFFLPFFRRQNITSAYEYLETRFSLSIRLFGSLSFIIFQLGRMTVVLFLPALALSAVTGINIYACIVVMGVLATVYTVLGGIEAVVWTDVLQVVVLLGGGHCCLAVIIGDTPGGIPSFFTQASEANQFRFYTTGWDYTMPVIWVVLLGGFFQNLISYGADQAVVQRYLTTKSEKAAANAIWMAAFVAIPGTILIFLLGSGLRVFFGNHPELLSPALMNDQVFPHFVAETLPAGVVGLVIAGIFAATMSTLDSSLNSVTAAYVTDFHRRFRPQASDASCLLLAKRLTLVLGAIAILLSFVTAANQESIRSLWDVYLKIIGLLMGCLTGVFMLGILTKRASATAAWGGAIAGMAVLSFVAFQTKTHGFLYSAIGILATFAVGYLLSFVFPNRTNVA